MRFSTIYQFVFVLLLLLPNLVFSQDDKQYASFLATTEEVILDIFKTDRSTAERKLNALEKSFAANPEFHKKYPELELEWIVAKCWLYYETGLDTDPLLRFLLKGNTLANKIIGSSKGADLASAHLYDITGRCIMTAFGDKPRAKLYFFKSLNLKYTHLPEWRPDILETRWNLTYMGTEEYVKERGALVESNIDLFKKHGNEHDFYLGYSYQTLADTYYILWSDQKKVDADLIKETAILYEKAAENFERVLGKKAYALSYPYGGLEGLYEDLNQIEKSTKFYEAKTAIRNLYLTPQLSYSEYLYKKIYAENSRRHPNLINKYYYQKYKNVDTLNVLNNPKFTFGITDLQFIPMKALALYDALSQKNEASMDTLKSIVELGDVWSQQQEFVLYNDNYQRERSAKNPYEKGLYEICHKAALDLYTITQEEFWLEKAYSLSNKSKQFLVKNAELQRLRSKKLYEYESQFKVIDDSIKIYELEAVRIEKQGIVENLPKIAINFAMLFDLKAKKDSLISFINVEIKIEDIKFETTLREKQEELSDNEIVIEYFPLIFHAKHEITCFYFDNEKVGYKLITKDDDFEKEILAFKKSIEENDFATYRKKGRLFYKKLIQPIESELEEKELIFIPDGVLSYLPFDLLLYEDFDTTKQNITYSELPYLFKKNTISYHYQSDFLIYQSKNKKDKSLSFVGFAPVAGEETELFTTNRKRSSLNDSSFQNLTEEEINKKLRSTQVISLPASAWEIAEITSKFVLGEALINEQATEEKFINVADEYDILHIASHCIVDDENPDLTRLVFSSESKDDGFLYLYELLQLDLQSELVVLSACNTGFGKINNGEGIASIAYGFAHAGSPNIVMSQWAIYDDFSAKIITSFYKYLSQGLAKNKALQSAKLEFLNDPSIPNEFKKPYYWGGFQFVGNSTPIQFKKSSMSGMVFWLLVAVCIALFSTAFYNLIKMD